MKQQAVGNGSSRRRTHDAVGAGSSSRRKQQTQEAADAGSGSSKGRKQQQIQEAEVAGAKSNNIRRRKQQMQERKQQAYEALDTGRSNVNDYLAGWRRKQQQQPIGNGNSKHHANRFQAFSFDFQVWPFGIKYRVWRIVQVKCVYISYLKLQKYYHNDSVRIL